MLLYFYFNYPILNFNYLYILYILFLCMQNKGDNKLPFFVVHRSVVQWQIHFLDSSMLCDYINYLLSIFLLSPSGVKRDSKTQTMTNTREEKRKQKKVKSPPCDLKPMRKNLQAITKHVRIHGLNLWQGWRGYVPTTFMII